MFVDKILRLNFITLSIPKAETSRYQDAKKTQFQTNALPLEKTLLFIASLPSSITEEKKSIRKGENHYKYGHVDSFFYEPGVLRQEVHSSMKKKVY